MASSSAWSIMVKPEADNVVVIIDGVDAPSSFLDVLKLLIVD